MSVVFKITDAETETSLDGLIIWTVYGSVYPIPFINGMVSIPSTGSFKGSRKDYNIMANGYVNHEGFFYQHDGKVIDVKLARFKGVPAPSIPVVVEPVGVAPVIKPLALIAGLSLLLR